jgi:hypothetical protein
MTHFLLMRSTKFFLDKVIDRRGAECTQLVRVYAFRYSAKCCGGEATVICVLQSLEAAGVAVLSDMGASAMTTRFSVVGPDLPCLRSPW